MYYIHNRFSKISTTFFVKKWSHIKPTYKKTNSFLLCMDLQSYRHNCFSKISRTLFDFLNNTFLFLRNKTQIFWTGVSCFSVTLFYSIPLLALTDRWMDRESNTLASRGLEEPAHALRGLEEPFFQLCCCVSFWFWREIGFGFYILLCTWSTIQLWCCVSFFCSSGK